MTILVQDFCPLKAEITRFPIAFRLRLSVKYTRSIQDSRAHLLRTWCIPPSCTRYLAIYIKINWAGNCLFVVHHNDNP